MRIIIARKYDICDKKNTQANIIEFCDISLTRVGKFNDSSTTFHSSYFFSRCVSADAIHIHICMFISPRAECYKQAFISNACCSVYKCLIKIRGIRSTQYKQ